MRVLITGHLGFVGTATRRLFDEQAMPYVGFDLMNKQDIRDYDHLAAFVFDHDIDRVLHLAAIARFADADANPKLAFETNVDGTRNVVQVCREMSIPLVYASTGSAIMPLDNYKAPYTEDVPARGNSIYGCTKALGEYLVREHTPHIILRYAHIYGIEKRRHGLVGGFWDRISRGMQPVLYGGRQTNDFTYIDDIAQANYLAVTASWDKWNQTYHIGTGEELSASAAGDLVCKATGYTGTVMHVEGRTVDPGRFVFDISKARRMLGYEPQYTFEQGLAKMFGKMLEERKTETQNNSDYYNSRQYTCRDDEERCKVKFPVSHGTAMRCTLPKGHQGKHLTPNDIEFD